MKHVAMSIAALMALICLAGTESAQEAEAAGASLVRLVDADDKPVTVKLLMRSGRSDQPDLTLHDGPYFRTGTEMGPGTLWHVNGARCVEVTGIESTGKELGTELVLSGGRSWLTRVREGANEFFLLDGTEARPVTNAEGAPFHERARITLGGDRAILYATTFDGELRLHEIEGSVARPLPVKDKRDHGAIMFAWDAGEVILASFYKDGGYHFRALKDGFFRSTLGDDDPAGEVADIHAKRFGGHVFLNIRRPREISEHWHFDGETMRPIADENIRRIAPWNRPAVHTVNDDGLYTAALDKSDAWVVLHCDGKTVKRVHAGEDVLKGATLPTVRGAGGAVFVQTGPWGEYETWMVSRGQASLAHKQQGRRPDRCALAAHLNGYDLLRFSADNRTRALGAWKDGAWLRREITIDNAPEDFGEIVECFNVQDNGVCVLEWNGLTHRLWRLTVPD